jgi:hypothetical protein
MRDVNAPEKFDFTELVLRLKELPADERLDETRDELTRTRALVIRDATRKFQHQLYIGRVERLLRHLKGTDVTRELTPTEVQAYALLSAQPPLAAAAASVIAPPPMPAVPAPAPAEAPAPEPLPQGKDRRVSRRIQMRTRVRIRRDSDESAEVVEPVNVSKGGISFQSRRRIELYETVFVTMHYQTEVIEMETRSLIVRAAPIAGSSEISYGVKFLE